MPARGFLPDSVIWWVRVPEVFRSWPMWAFFLLLFAASTVRGQCVYGLARWVTERALNRELTGRWRRVHAWLTGDEVGRGVWVIRRWGLVAIPLCHLTVGVQTLVIAGAGVVRVPWPAFTLAQVPGSLAWATIYTTIGWAVWEAAVKGAVGSPLGLGVLVALAVMVVAWVWWRRRGASTAR